MPLPDQTPGEEFTERVGETAAGTIVVPHLIATDDYRRNQHAARKATADTRHIMRKLMMDGAGMTEDDMPNNGQASDEMGDIIYTGDIVLRPGTEVQLGNSRIKYDHEPVKPADPQPPAIEPPPTAPTTPTTPAPTPVVSDEKSNLSKFVWPVVLGGGLLAAGAGGMAIYNWLTDKPDSVTTINQPPSPQTDWKLGIQVHD